MRGGSIRRRRRTGSGTNAGARNAGTMSDEKLALKFMLTPPFGSLGVRSVRRTVSFLAAAWGFDEDACNNIALALSEAINNAREHGSEEGSRIEITCVLGTGNVKLVVEDFGDTDKSGLRKAFDSRDPPSKDSVRGRGIYLIRSLMDGVEVKRKEKGGVALTMIKRGS
jgi:serine/threonine-protein kinase RsbW